MRYWAALIGVLSLGVLGCSGTGGNGGADLCEGVACDDGNDCTKDVCDPSDGACSNVPLADGSFCDVGYCQGGECDAIDSVFDCTEQGIRDAIAAGGGPHTFDCDDSTAVKTDDVIVIDNDVILDGLGKLTIDGARDEVLEIEVDSTVALLRLTTTRGYTGILNHGTLTMTDCVVTENAAADESSASGIDNRGTLTMTNCIVSRNEHGERVAGILNSGVLTMMNCAVVDNVSIDEGGIVNRRTLVMTNTVISGNLGETGGGIVNTGELAMTGCTVANNSWGDIDNFGNGEITMVNSTVSNNAEFHGVSNSGTLMTMTNCTVSGDGSAGDFGPRISSAEDTLTVTNSIIDGGCNGEITSGGHNIESPGNTCGLDQTGDQSDVTEAELNLGPLADNGGPTMTHKPGDGGLGEGSVAIDAIPEADCAVDTDQRGESRSVVIVGPESCDVGSVEVQADE